MASRSLGTGAVRPDPRRSTQDRFSFPALRFNMRRRLKNREEGDKTCSPVVPSDGLLFLFIRGRPHAIPGFTGGKHCPDYPCPAKAPEPCLLEKGMFSQSPGQKPLLRSLTSACA